MERIDLLVKAAEPPTNHCSPLLTEHGTTAFQPLFTKVIAVPGFPSIKRADVPNVSALAFAGENLFTLPSINRSPIFELGSATVAAALPVTAGQAVAGYE